MTSGSTNPNIAALKLSGGAFTLGALTPTTISGSFYSVAGNKITQAVAIAKGSEPLVAAFKYTSPDAVMNARTVDSTLGSQSFFADFSPDGNILAVVIQDSPYITFYSVSDGNLVRIPFTTGLTDYSSLCWSPDSKYVVAMNTFNTAPRTFKRVGTTITDITTTAGLVATGVSDYAGGFTPNGNYLILPGFTSGRSLEVYTNNGNDTFTFVRSILSNLSNDTRMIRFTADGTLMFMAADNGGLAVYSHDGVGNFTKLTSPTGLPAGQCLAVVVSPNDETISVSSTTSPYIYTWVINKATAPDTWTSVALPAGVTLDNDSRNLTYI